MRSKQFLFFIILTIFSVFFFSACSSDESGSNNNIQDHNNNPQHDNQKPETETKPVEPIDLTGNPFSLLGVYKVELYGVNGDAVENPLEESELRVGLNLTTSSSGMPEVLMMLRINGKFIMFDKYNIDLSNMGSDLNKFISETFKNLGAELVPDSKYNLMFTLNPADNRQYMPLVDKSVIADNEYLKLKLLKVKDLKVENGLEIDMSQVPVENIYFDMTEYTITKKERFKLKVDFYPYGTSSKLKWWSSDPNRVEVNDEGEINIKGNGDVKITATTENGKVAALDLKPSYLTTDNFKLNKNKVILYINKDGNNPTSHQLEVYGVPPILVELKHGFKYLTQNGDSIISVGNDGKITAKAVGNDVVTVRLGVDERKCEVEVQNYPEGITFEKQQYSIKKGEPLKIQTFLLGTTTPINAKYTVDKPNIVNIDSEGNVTTTATGDVEVTATYEANNQTFTAKCMLIVYTPIDIQNPASLQGTYDFVDFKSDSFAPFGVKVFVGTTTEPQYKGSVQRMIGEMVLTYNNNTVNMTTKIQMESSKLEGGTMGVNTSGEQLALTKYDPVNYSGNNDRFGSKGSITKGEVKQQGDLLVISQYFKKSGADVYVSTFLRKKSDIVKDIPKTRYFDYMDEGKSKESNAKRHNLGDGGPSVEPHFTVGLINH